jgi:hypothetical protein
MSSGEKQLVVNPLERAVSVDIIRAQSFIGQAMNEMLRALLDTKQGTDDVSAGGLYSPNTTAGTPSSALIFAGLLFQVTGGSTACSVGPGTLGIFDPDATPSGDDSQYKLITVPIGSPTLNLTPNSSGSLRIDVIECARLQPDAIIETDSRDVFNTTTGLFAAATVNKVSQAQLQFRIRLGTPGSAYPGNANGWLPIAVVSVPTGTTVWDTCTIWDVRPLAEDLAFNMTQTTKDLPALTRVSAMITASGGLSQTVGVVEAVLDGRRIGGLLRSSSNAAALSGDATYALDIDDAQNQSVGQTPSATAFNYLYLALPYGLPRWARYTVGPTGRLPRSPRGILIASSIAPDLEYGTPTANLHLIPSLQDSANGQHVIPGLPATATCILARFGTSGGTAYGGLIARGGRHWAAISNVPSIGTPTNTASMSGGNAQFTYTPGTDFPAHARAMLVRITLTYTISGGTLNEFVIGQPIFQVGATTATGVMNVIPEGGPSLVGPVGPTYSAQTIVLTGVVRIPVFSWYGLAGTPGITTPGDAETFGVTVIPTVSSSGAGTLALTAGASVTVGWETSEND